MDMSMNFDERGRTTDKEKARLVIYLADFFEPL